MARAAAPDAFDKLVKLMKSPDERIRLQACIEILNRGWGKLAQAIIGGDEDDAPGYDLRDELSWGYRTKSASARLLTLVMAIVLKRDWPPSR